MKGTAASSWARLRGWRTSTATALGCAATLAIGGVVAGGAVGAGTPGPALAQLDWVVGILNGSSPPSTAELRRHFAPGFLQAVPPQELLIALYPTWSGRPVTIRAISEARPTTAEGTLATRHASFQVSIQVEPGGTHEIIGLRLQPLAASAASWHEVDRSLRELGAHAALYVGLANGDTLHALNASTPLAIGSAFKLYVLGALAQAIAQGRAGWQQRLAISAAHKSLPTVGMALDPPGSRRTLSDFAAQMIAASDNTAADHLIARLGRTQVEQQLRALGNRTPGLDEPFLTARELFALKLAAPARLRNGYSAGDSVHRRALLRQVDDLTPTLHEERDWTTPRLIGRIEWFASAADLGRAIATLVARSRTPVLAPLRTILAINPGLALPRSAWHYVAFKGGSEPGVLSMTWYLERHDGARFTVSLIVNDPRRQIDEATAEAVAEAVIAKLATESVPER
jgi:beta-lactamase class A